MEQVIEFVLLFISPKIEKSARYAVQETSRNLINNNKKPIRQNRMKMCVKEQIAN